MRRRDEGLPKLGAVEVGIEVTGASDHDAGNAVDFGQGCGDLLGDDAGGFLQAFGQFEAHG